MKYDYMIAFNYQNQSVGGFGNWQTTLDKKINNMQDLKSIKDFIENEYKISNVVILNYILIKRHWR